MLAKALGLVLCLVAAGCTTADGDGPSSTASNVAPAIVVPLLAAPILLDGTLSPGEWNGAWQEEGVFDLPGEGLPTGLFPFRFQVAGDPNALYLSIEIEHLSALNAGDENDTTYVDVVEFLLSPDRPDLVPPADKIACAIAFREGYSSCVDRYWTGMVWSDQPNTTGTSTYNQGRPTDGRWGTGGMGPNGSLVWEHRIDRRTSYPEMDGFSAEGAEPFRLALKLARIDPATHQNNSRPPPYDIHADVHPSEGPTKENEYDPSTWWRFRFPE